MYKPRWAFELYCEGAGDRICANDEDLPISQAKRIFYRMRGFVLQALFGWFWWESEKTGAER